MVEKSWLERSRPFIRNFYAKLSVLVDVCLVGDQSSGRGFVESELEGELKVHGDDFSSEFQDL